MSDRSSSDGMMITGRASALPRHAPYCQKRSREDSLLQENLIQMRIRPILRPIRGIGSRSRVTTILLLLMPAGLAVAESSDPELLPVLTASLSGPAPSRHEEDDLPTRFMEAVKGDCFY